MSKLKFNADDYILKYFLDAVGQHFAQAWMADYNADEVGQYLIDNKYGISQTGSYQIEIQKDGIWKASRAEFLKWRLSQRLSTAVGQTEPKENATGSPADRKQTK